MAYFNMVTVPLIRYGQIRENVGLYNCRGVGLQIDMVVSLYIRRSLHYRYCTWTASIHLYYLRLYACMHPYPCI